MEHTSKDLALKVINQSMKLKFIKVDRSKFLTKTFGNQVDDIQKLLEHGPQKFFSKAQLDKQAQKSIDEIVIKSSTLSFFGGIPGGFAIAATVPADIAQFYGYSLKLAQEISYIYGYQNIFDPQGELTEEAKNTLILYLGVMLGVNSAGSAVRVLSSKMAAQTLKKLPEKTLTKTFYYPLLKKVMTVFGGKLTKSTVAKGVSKVIPVVGGVISGSMNYLALRPMATRLKNELSKSINYTQTDLNKDIKILNEENVIFLDDQTN